MKDPAPDITDGELQHHRPNEKYCKSTAKTDRVKDITPNIDYNRQQYRSDERYCKNTA